MKTKILLTLITMCSITALAHTTNKMTCYRSLKNIMHFAPQVLCLENITSVNKNTIEVVGGNMSGIYKIGTDFKGNIIAKQIIENNDGDICTSSRNVAIVLNSNTNSVDNFILQDLSVSVEIETALDSCHSIPEVEEISYSKIN